MEEYATKKARVSNDPSKARVTGNEEAVERNLFSMPLRVMQEILSHLAVPDLCVFDTACSSSSSTKKRLIESYNYLKSAALDTFQYTKKEQLHWIMIRCINITNIHFELPSHERAETTLKNRNGMALWSKKEIKTWPTLHWLMNYAGGNREADRDLVMLLASHSAKEVIEATDGSGWTALHLACDLGDVELVSALLSNGANVNALTKNSHTPLTRSIYWGSVACIRLLLAYGANASACEQDGNTLLHRAVCKAGVGQRMETAATDITEELPYQCVQLLLEHGALVVPNAKGYTALHEAELLGYERVAQPLRERVVHGAPQSQDSILGDAAAALASLHMM
jgi:ankyrin repeat protein